jgi:quercetin 2,3-dioxygenase
MLEVRRSRDRGYSDKGWLKTFHSFAFADYFDPEHVEFGPLRVINEQRMKPGASLAPESCQDMEVLTYVLQGEVRRKDSLGHTTVLKAGDVQRVSAGSGIELSASNASATVEAHVLQIWIRPAKLGTSPTMETKHFPLATKQATLRLIASPTGVSGSVKIQQDARIYAAVLNDTQQVHLDVDRQRCVYVHVARGSVAVNDTRLNLGDAVKVTQATRITLTHGSDAEVIVLNLPAARLHTVFHRERTQHSRAPAPHPTESFDPVNAEPEAQDSPESEPAAAATPPRAKRKSAIPAARRPPEQRKTAARAAAAKPFRGVSSVRKKGPGSSAGSGRRGAPRKATSGK